MTTSYCRLCDKKLRSDCRHDACTACRREEGEAAFLCFDCGKPKGKNARSCLCRACSRERQALGLPVGRNSAILPRKEVLARILALQELASKNLPLFERRLDCRSI